VARLLAEALARAGVVVVSGMARGVDAAAHEGAVACAGETWAVWGTGPDRVYPPEHRRLAEDIAGHGALLTEYPPGTPPRKHHFPERNRLLAGVADAVVVVEAAARSGALVTARLAVDEGREVFAVPGSIFSDLSIGPNTLLRLGARPLLNPNDVLQLLEVSSRPAAEQPVVGGDALRRLLKAGETVTADELAARAERPVAEVLQQLLQWELEGLVQRQSDGRYSLVRGIPLAGG
jgi:DNA processing protein